MNLENLTTKELENAKNYFNSDLMNYVIDDIINKYDDLNDRYLYIKEILKYGCQSGIVSDLIYYRDTCHFYETYKEEINKMLGNLLEETGMSLEEIFKDFDITDPFILHDCNKNLLAWYGFESCVYSLSEYIEFYY